MQSRRARAVATFLGALLALVIAFVGGDQSSDRTLTNTVTVPAAPAAQTVPLGGPGDATVTLSPGEQRTVDNQVAGAKAKDPDVEHGLKQRAPAAPAAKQAAEDLKPAGQPDIPRTVPAATPHTAGCKTAMVRNYSSRNGAPVLLGVIHWTGSYPGSGEAIVRYFDTLAASASSNYVEDRGKCWYTVAETAKAWTQAAYNPWSVSVEIVNPGVLPLFYTKADRQSVINLMIGWHHRWHIPYQLGAVSGGRVTRPGFLAHRDLGALGGGHPDVGIPSAVPGLIADAKAQDHPGVTAADRHRCKRVKAYRDRRRRHLKPTAKGTAAFKARIRLQHQRHHPCVDGSPRK